MEMIDVECSRCTKNFAKKRHVVVWHRAHDSKCKFYCSRICKNGKPRCDVTCKNCNNKIIKFSYEILKSKNIFCTRSCSATYNNTHKKHGTRRSKLEVWLEEALINSYPTLEFHFNRKDAINSELDIYIYRC